MKIPNIAPKWAVETYRDLVKTAGTVVLNGSSTYVIKDINMGVKPSRSIYNNTHSIIPSWFLTDFLIARSVKIAKHTPILKHLPADVINSALSLPIYTTLKFMSQDKDSLNQLYAKKNKSPEELLISEAMKNKGIAKLVGSLSHGYTKHIEKPLDTVFSTLLGVEPPRKLQNEVGEDILGDDGKSKYSEPAINMKKYFGSSLAIVLASLFTLGKDETTVGFEDSKSPIAALRSFSTYTLSRINHGIFSSIPKNLKGFNFPRVFNNILVNKLPNTMVQSAIDAGTGIFRVKYINPASMAIMLKFLSEVTLPVFTRGLMRNMTDDLKVPQEADYISHKYLKPFIISAENLLYKPFQAITKNLYSKIGGMYSPEVPGMYDRSVLQDDLNGEGVPDYLKHYDKGLVSDILLTLKNILIAPKHIIDAIDSSSTTQTTLPQTLLHQNPEYQTLSRQSQ